MILWIDADPLIYKAAYVTEYTLYRIDGQVFKYKADVMEYIRGRGLDEKLLTTQPVLDPIDNSKLAIYNLVKKIVKDCKGHYGTIDRYAVVLSGTTNFRNKIYPEYKKGRDKPKYYKELRQTLLNWGAFYQEPLEADDYIAIKHDALYRKNKDSSIIASIDKDLYILPGHHYDYRRQEHKFYPEDKAEQWFHRQLLHGDRTDNIPGIYRLGAKKAKEMVRYLKGEGKDREPVLREIVIKWKKYAPDTYKEQLIRNWKLLDIGGYYKQYLPLLKKILEEE